MSEFLSQNFSLKEFVQSWTALEKNIDNTPTPEIKEQLKFTAHGLERIRAVLNKRITLDSGYRCIALNNAVGGSKNSQHMQGKAVDFKCPAFGSPLEIVTHLIPFVKILGIDQMIMEVNWVHVSFDFYPRYQVLKFENGKYLPWS